MEGFSSPSSQVLFEGTLLQMRCLRIERIDKKQFQKKLHTTLIEILQSHDDYIDVSQLYGIDNFE